VETRRVGANPVELLRGLLLAVLVIGLLGTVTELVLLEHYEQVLQLVPVVLIAAALVAIAWQLISRNVGSLRALEIIMISCPCSRASPASLRTSTARRNFSSISIPP
jgi:hypothetical protein